MADQEKQPPQHNTQLVALNNVKALLEASKGAVASRLPRHLTADRILKVALTAINKTPKLLECSRESLMTAIMQAAELGLEPGGALGEGYLVPYNNKIKLPGGAEKWVMQCQFIPGYRGLIALARRSGDISNLYAEAVYKCDKFEVELGLEPKLLHKPDYDSEERDDVKNLTLTYAVARFKDGSFQFVVLGRKQIERLRERSKAADSGPWVSDFEEMAKKTSIRRLSKYLPLSVEMAKAVELQGAAEAGDFTTIEGPTFELDPGIETKALIDEAPSRSDAVKAAVHGKAAAAAKAGKEKPASGTPPASTAQTSQAPTPETARMNEIFALLGWTVETQAKWCKANAALSAEDQVKKLEKELDDDSGPQSGSQQTAQYPEADGEQTHPPAQFGAGHAKPGPVAVDRQQTKSTPAHLDTEGWT